jgi:ATP-binding cassette, subfamily B, bacterial MsbA
MSHFGRVIRLSLRHRKTFIASLVCAVMVGVLWGGNIGTVFPVVKVAFENRSLQQWIEGEITKSRETVGQQGQSLDKLHAELAAAAPERRTELEGRIRSAESQMAAEQKALTRYEWVQPYVERYLPHDPFATLALFIGVLLASTIVKDAFLIAHTVLVARLSESGTFALRKLFYRRTLKMDLASFRNEGTSDLMSRFTFDMETLTTGLNILFGKLIREPIKAAACLIGAGLICWRLLLLSLVIAPIAAYLIRWLAKALKRANRRAMEEMAQLYNTLEETFRGIKVVKAFAMERYERRRFHLNSKNYLRRALRIAEYDSLTRPITEAMGILTICLALLAGAYLVLSGETHLLGIRMSERPLDLATLLVFYGLLAGTADPFRKLSEVFAHIQRASAAADRIFATLDRQSKIRDPEKSVALPRHHRDIVFDNVNFAYQGGELVLRGINLRVRAGETVALVGPNGCGKSTLADLIPRFADPVSGEIRLDGVPLPATRIRDLRAQIGMVAQETLLFDDTVMNNIRYGSPHATDQDVIEAARQAHAHRFIENDLPEGYQTVVGSGGNRLSGGQRQRIALARAILHNPAILILDEATSQVDLESEQLIQKVLERFTQNRTTIIITHRLAALTLADRIVVMDAGRILDLGTHKELIGRCELYRRLYEIHFADLRESA